jgi:hypothetical protein
VDSAVVALLIAIIIVVVAIVVVLRLLLAELARIAALRDAQARNAIERPSGNRLGGKAGVSALEAGSAAGAAGTVVTVERVALEAKSAEIEAREQELGRRAGELDRFAARLEAKAVEIETGDGAGLVPSTVDAPRHVRTRDILKLTPISGWKKVRSGASLMALVLALGITTAGLIGALGVLIYVALERTVS